MRAVAPRVGAPEIMLAEEQEEYKTVCAAVITHDDGTIAIMTRWKFNDDERERIAEGEDLYLRLFTFGQPMNPIHIEVGRPAWATDGPP